MDSNVCHGLAFRPFDPSVLTGGIRPRGYLNPRRPPQVQRQREFRMRRLRRRLVEAGRMAARLEAHFKPLPLGELLCEAPCVLRRPAKNEELSLGLPGGGRVPCQLRGAAMGVDGFVD